MFLGEIDVDAPYLDLHIFNPVKKQVDYAEYFGMRSVNESNSNLY